MNTFFLMLPVYLFGNLHCMGMCGPLVMMIGKHRYRSCYFLGRTLSFTMAGLAAGGFGAVANVFFERFKIPAFTSLIFGGAILLLGCCYLFGWKNISFTLPKSINQTLSKWILEDRPLSTFLFGLMTIALPCGQTLIVYSACALSGSLWTGLFNGFAFALLTSPSLFFAMNAHLLFQRMKHHYNTLLGCSALLVGALSILRALADLDMIDHFILNPSMAREFHLVLF